jgi:hypothetical protein
MGGENMVYIHNGNLFGENRNKTVKYAGKWMELEIIVFSPNSYTQTTSQEKKEHESYRM